jgi:hypothetical protein
MTEIRTTRLKRDGDGHRPRIKTLAPQILNCYGPASLGSKKT